jgi:hypothetical protein
MLPDPMLAVKLRRTGTALILLSLCAASALELALHSLCADTCTCPIGSWRRRASATATLAGIAPDTLPRGARHAHVPVKLPAIEAGWLLSAVAKIWNACDPAGLLCIPGSGDTGSTPSSGCQPGEGAGMYAWFISCGVPGALTSSALGDAMSGAARTCMQADMAERCPRPGIFMISPAVLSHKHESTVDGKVVHSVIMRGAIEPQTTCSASHADVCVRHDDLTHLVVLLNPFSSNFCAAAVLLTCSFGSDHALCLLLCLISQVLSLLLLYAAVD